jgi:hypothetical protein
LLYFVHMSKLSVSVQIFVRRFSRVSFHKMAQICMAKVTLKQGIGGEKKGK